MAMSEQEDSAIMKELLAQSPLVDDLTCCYLVMDVLVRFINTVKDNGLEAHMGKNDILSTYLAQNYISARQRGVLDPMLAVEIAIRKMKEEIERGVKPNEQ